MIQGIRIHLKSLMGRLYTVDDRVLRLRGWIPFKSTNILRCNKPRVVTECHVGAMRAGNEVWWGHSLDIDKVETHSTSTYPIRLSTIQTPPQRLVAFQMPLATGETPRADSAGLGLSNLSGFLVARAGSDELGVAAWALRCRNSRFAIADNRLGLRASLESHCALLELWVCHNFFCLSV